MFVVKELITSYFHYLYYEWLAVATSRKLVVLCVGVLTGTSEGLAGPRILEEACRGACRCYDRVLL